MDRVKQLLRGGRKPAAAGCTCGSAHLTASGQRLHEAGCPAGDRKRMERATEKK